MPRKRVIQLQLVAVIMLAGGALAAIASQSGDSTSTDGAAPTTTPASHNGIASEPPASTEPSTTTTERSRSRFADRVPDFPEPPPAEAIQLPPSRGAPLLHRIPTTQPVAFITIDDGLVPHPEAVELIREADVPTSLFLISGIARQHKPFFDEILRTDSKLQTHTISHDNLDGASYEKQRHEICDGAEELAASFGQRPTLFRPPGGAYDSTTLQAAADCGMRAVLHWSETVNNGALQYQTPEHRVRPGDIILMHFRHTFVEDFLAALDAIKAAGLTPARLEDYLK